ncbi:MAG: ABC transporter permease subunit [Alphaproteobacteria bacterium]|nr:ABC transporter permease subunit [Alphaproteobacteria bacterium]
MSASRSLILPPEPRPTARQLLRRWGLRLAAFLIAAWSLGPFLWQVSTAFQPDALLMASPPHILPWPGTLEHFYNVFAVKHFQYYILNSAIVALATTAFCLVFGLLAAYALARFDVRGRFGVLGVILSISMFPQIAIVAPLYLFMSSVGLLDTYTVLVIVYLALGLPLVVWVLFGYLQSIPRDLDEAAKIDGAGPIRILVQIILPMALPGVVTTGLLAFIAAWNEFMFALSFTSGIAHQTIPVGIANFQNLYYVPWGDVAAASTVVTVPLVLLVLGFQRRIIDGLTQGAVRE